MSAVSPGCWVLPSLPSRQMLAEQLLGWCLACQGLPCPRLQSDIVSLHCPLMASTFHIIDANRWAAGQLCVCA